MSGFKYFSQVSEDEFKDAILRIQKAIAKKDTPEEWAQFAGKILLVVGRVAVNQVGLGPAVSLIQDIFDLADDEDLIKVLRYIGEIASNED